MTNKKTLITLKIGRNEYAITEQDRFCANASSVTLIGQAKVNPELKAKHIKEINKFERVQHEHEFGKTISIFSLKRKRSDSQIAADNVYEVKRAEKEKRYGGRCSNEQKEQLNRLKILHDCDEKSVVFKALDFFEKNFK